MALDIIVETFEGLELKIGNISFDRRSLNRYGFSTFEMGRNC